MNYTDNEMVTIRLSKLRRFEEIEKQYHEMKEDEKNYFHFQFSPPYGTHFQIMKRDNLVMELVHYIIKLQKEIDGTKKKSWF